MKRRALLIIFSKELKTTFRDTRTVLVSILIPITLFPVIIYLMSCNIKKNNTRLQEHIKISMNNHTNSLAQFLKNHTQIELTKPSLSIEKALKKGGIYAALMIPDHFDQSIKENQVVSVYIKINNTNQLSLLASETITSLLKMYSETLKHRLNYTQGNQQQISPLHIQKQFLYPEKEASGTLLLSFIFPILFLVYTAISPLAVAADLGAGEKERATLEPLLTTRTSRLTLLLGKYAAIITMGMISSAAFMSGFLLSYLTSKDFFGKNIIISLPIASLLLLAVTACILIMIYGSIELSISIFARSAKETQIYSLPVLIVSVAAGYATFMVDVFQLDSLYLHIPLVNISIIIKEIILSIYNPVHLAIVCGWSCVYIITMVCLTLYLFSREQVMFRQ